MRLSDLSAYRGKTRTANFSGKCFNRPSIRGKWEAPNQRKEWTFFSCFWSDPVEPFSTNQEKPFQRNLVLCFKNKHPPLPKTQLKGQLVLGDWHLVGFLSTIRLERDGTLFVL